MLSVGLCEVVSSYQRSPRHIFLRCLRLLYKYVASSSQAVYDPFG